MPIQIPEISPPTPLARLGDTTSALPSWRAGQLLDALVTAVGDDGAGRLRIGGRELRALLPPRLSVGQALRLEVLGDGDALPRLRILDAGVPAAPLVQLLRHSLPRAQPLGQALGEIAALATAPGADQRTRVMAARLIEILPRWNSVQTADGLRAAIAASGVQLEAALARGRIPRRDLKLRLLESLTMPNRGDAPQAPSIAPLKSALEGALAAIETRQTQPLLSSSRGEPPLLRVDLPLFSPDGAIETLRLDVDRESDPPDAADGEPSWRIRMHLDPRGIGPLDIALQLRGERARVDLWAERSSTHALLATQLPRLEAGLREAGFDVDTPRLHPGRPARRAGEAVVPGATHLLDTRA